MMIYNNDIITLQWRVNIDSLHGGVKNDMVYAANPKRAGYGYLAHTDEFRCGLAIAAKSL